MDKLAEHLGYGSPFIYAAAAYFLFLWLDGNASAEAKSMLASTMKIKDYDKTHIASALTEVFDRLYTSPLLHWRAFLRSAIFSTVLMSIFVFEAEKSPGVTELRSLTHTGYLNFYGPAFAVNLLSDYVSLFMIRPWLGRFGSKPVFALISGIVLAILIVVVGVLLRLALSDVFIHQPVLDVPPRDFVHEDDPYKAFLESSSGQAFLRYITGVVSFAFFTVLPTFAVFAWLPLLALGILVVRALSPLQRIVEKAQWSLKDGNEHPLKAVGCVAAIAVFAISAAWQKLA